MALIQICQVRKTATKVSGNVASYLMSSSTRRFNNDFSTLFITNNNRFFLSLQNQRWHSLNILRIASFYVTWKWTLLWRFQNSPRYFLKITLAIIRIFMAPLSGFPSHNFNWWGSLHLNSTFDCFDNILCFEKPLPFLDQNNKKILLINSTL